MKSLGQVLKESMADVYILSEADKRFIGSFGSADKPVALAEWLEFWAVLTDSERTEIMMDYEPEMYPGTDGFKG